MKMTIRSQNVPTDCNAPHLKKKRGENDSEARRERKKDMMEEKRVRREDGDVKRHKKEK